MSEPAAVVEALRGRGWTLAVAESLTGGLVCARVVDVPGASRVLRGGVVAYTLDAKRSVLGVDATLLDEVGAVHADVAAQMAAGVRRLLSADLALATTGVAGPGPDGRHPAGTVEVACVSPTGTTTRSLRLSGSRDDVRRASVDAALTLALEVLAAGPVGEEAAADPV